MKSYPAYLVCFLIIGIVYSKWALNLSLQNTLLVSVFYIAAQFSLAFIEEWVGIHSFRIALSNQILSQKQHDFKQQIATLAFLAEGEEYKELKQYCHSLLNQSFEGRIQTGNPVVNAIVNQKGIQARKQGVDFTVESDKLPVSLPIENIDLSVLIGNLLDNAVEACRELKDAKITLKIKIFPGYLAIRVTNPVKENIQRTNPHLHSSKKNKETHGWGLPSIRMIAEKYSGKLCIEMKEKSFEATVMLFWKK